MKSHIKLLQRLNGLSAILAFQSIFSFEYPYQQQPEDGTLSTLDGEGELPSRVICDASLENPILTATESSDGEQLRVRINARFKNYPDLAIMLAAIGGKVNDESGEVSFHFPARKSNDGKSQIEVLWERWTDLDHLWIANRRLSLYIDDPKVVVDRLLAIFHRANEWQKLRDWEFMGVDMSEAEEDKLHAQAEDFRNKYSGHSWLGIPQVTSLKIIEDPRGGCFLLTFEDGASQTFSASTVDWAVAPLYGSAYKLPESVSHGKFAIKPTKVHPDVVGVLDSLLVQGNTVKIIDKLSPKLYKQVDEMLRCIGGQWHSGSASHIFQDNPEVMIDEIVATGAIYTRKDFEFFETQEEEANRAVLVADLEEGMVVLEPNAGRGALALKAAAIVGKQNVICYELMAANVMALKELGFVLEAPTDFLAVEPREVADRVIANPPFSDGRDIAHIQHAFKFLKPGGKLVSIASTQWQTSDHARSKAFRAWLQTLGANVEQISSGAFKEVGTNVATTLVCVTKPLAAPPITAKSVQTKAAPKRTVVKEEQQDLFA